MTPPSHSAPLVSWGVQCAAARTPDKIALWDLEGGRRTYRQLWDRAQQIAVFLREGLGLKRGERIGLVAGNRIEYAECVVGIATAGLAAVTINPAATPQELGAYLETADVKAVFSEPALCAQLAALEKVPADRIIALGDGLERCIAEARGTAAYTVSAEDVFAISFTSGSTGSPRAVMLSHRARTLMFAFALAGNYGLHTAALRAVAVSPFFNGGGLAHLLAPLFFGGTVCVPGKFDPERMLAALSESIAFATLVPTQAAAMLELPVWPDLPHLRALVTNSAASSADLKARIAERVGAEHLYESYGSTETGIIAGIGPGDLLERPDSIGRSVPAAEIRLLDDTGNSVPRGEVGEVACRTPWLFSGYLNEKPATDELFIDGWCMTGDLARMDDDGFLSIVGRRKQVIISGGQNVYPPEVENALAIHPAIAEVAVVGLPDPYWGEAVAAAYTVRPGTERPPEGELRAYLKQRLSGYKVPKTLHQLPAMPLNATGKVQHAAVREQLMQAMQTAEAS